MAKRKSIEEIRAKRREYSRKWREKNRERYREVQRQWREKNKERYRECLRQWREKNKDYFMSAWRTVLITKPCRLSMKNRQLVYEPKDEKSVRVALEDITVIVIEDNRSTLTTALLSHISEHNIVLFTCDSYHMPNGLFTPFHQHSRLSQISHIQVEMKLPLKKQIWQKGRTLF